MTLDFCRLNFYVGIPIISKMLIPYKQILYTACSIEKDIFTVMMSYRIEMGKYVFDR